MKVNMWKVVAYRADGTMLELWFDTREGAKEMYALLAADNEFCSYRMESPVLTEVD
jgi:hypothetical protein